MSPEARTSSPVTCRELVQNGAETILDHKTKKAGKRKCLTAFNLRNEAEGTRTLNLRIDSLIGVFVSICRKTTNG